jgi:serine phosphatase RsbU (regulator of sigma subunit)
VPDPEFDSAALAAAVSHQFAPPSLPEIAGWQFSGLLRPAHVGAGVAGDWYDAIELPDAVLLVLGDVMGKGPAAVPDMGQLRMGVRALALAIADLGDLLMAMDRLHDISSSLERFATALLMRIPLAGGEVLVASAGHLPPVLLGGDGRARVVPIPVGPPIGVPAEQYRAVPVAVGLGETLLAGSDGVIEDRGGADLVAAVLHQVEASAASPLPDLLTAVADLAAGGDDVTLLGARRLR